MDTRKAAFRSTTMGEMAHILLATRSSHSLSTVGVNWLSNFIKYRDKLYTYFSKRYNYQRALNKNPKSLRN